MEKDFSSLEQAIGVTFSNKELFRQALVHRSYLNEHPEFTLDHNERLEFLGDAVLELIVTEYLYRNYPNPEGEMTNWRAALVNSSSLAEVSTRLNVEKYLYLSRGESKDNNGKARASILANACEAIIGAIFLDRGWEAAKGFIERNVLSKLPSILENKLYLDPKSRLQEASQDKLAVTPIYKVLNEKGPDHKRQFEIGVFLGETLVAKGEGASKQEAQIEAAEQALAKKKWV